MGLLSSRTQARFAPVGHSPADLVKGTPPDSISDHPNRDRSVRELTGGTLASLQSRLPIVDRTVEECGARRFWRCFRSARWLAFRCAVRPGVEVFRVPSFAGPLRAGRRISGG